MKLKDEDLLQRLAQFVAERNDALASGDVKRVRAQCEKWGAILPADDATLEVSMHKARTGNTGLSLELRRESKRWLEARGYQVSLDDGDL